MTRLMSMTLAVLLMMASVQSCPNLLKKLSNSSGNGSANSNGGNTAGGSSGSSGTGGSGGDNGSSGDGSGDAGGGSDSTGGSDSAGGSDSGGGAGGAGGGDSGACQTDSLSAAGTGFSLTPTGEIADGAATTLECTGTNEVIRCGGAGQAWAASAEITCAGGSFDKALSDCECQATCDVLADTGDLSVSYDVAPSPRALPEAVATITCTAGANVLCGTDAASASSRELTCANGAYDADFATCSCRCVSLQSIPGGEFGSENEFPADTAGASVAISSTSIINCIGDGGGSTFTCSDNAAEFDLSNTFTCNADGNYGFGSGDVLNAATANTACSCP